MTKVISKDELKEKLIDIKLIDVRDSHSYKFGHIQSARDIPLENLENEFKQKYNPEEKNIVIYGEDENQGMEAAKKLENLGYKNIEVYKEGFQEWRHSHLPIKRVDLGNEQRTERKE
jgi:rhodanese-related sulfurtransferase